MLTRSPDISPMAISAPVEQLSVAVNVHKPRFGKLYVYVDDTGHIHQPMITRQYDIRRREQSMPVQSPHDPSDISVGSRYRRIDAIIENPVMVPGTVDVRGMQEEHVRLKRVDQIHRTAQDKLRRLRVFADMYALIVTVDDTQYLLRRTGAPEDLQRNINIGGNEQCHSLIIGDPSPPT